MIWCACTVRTCNPLEMAVVTALYGDVLPIRPFPPSGCYLKISVFNGSHSHSFIKISDNTYEYVNYDIFKGERNRNSITGEYVVLK